LSIVNRLKKIVLSFKLLTQFVGLEVFPSIIMLAQALLNRQGGKVKECPIPLSCYFALWNYWNNQRKIAYFYFLGLSFISFCLDCPSQHSIFEWTTTQISTKCFIIKHLAESTKWHFSTLTSTFTLSKYLHYLALPAQNPPSKKPSISLQRLCKSYFLKPINKKLI